MCLNFAILKVKRKKAGASISGSSSCSVCLMDKTGTNVLKFCANMKYGRQKFNYCIVTSLLEMAYIASMWQEA